MSGASTDRGDPAAILGALTGLVRSLSQRGYVLIMAASVLMATSAALFNRWLDRALAERRAYKELTEVLGQAEGEPNAREARPQWIALAAHLAGFDMRFECDADKCSAIDQFLVDVQEAPLDSEIRLGRELAIMPCPNPRQIRGSLPICVGTQDADLPGATIRLPVVSAHAAPSVDKRTVFHLFRVSEWLRDKLRSANLAEAGPVNAVQAWFTSPEGFHRAWEMDGRNVRPAEVTDQRGRKYVNTYLDPDDVCAILADLDDRNIVPATKSRNLQASRPYLDAANQGMVRSRQGPVCQHGRLVGVIGIDYRMPRNATAQESSAGREPDAPMLDNATLRRLDPLVQAAVVQRDRLRSVAFLRGVIGKTPPASMRVVASPETEDRSAVGIVPLAAINERQYVVVLRIANPPIGESFYSMLGSLIGCILFVGAVIAGRRRLLKLDEESAVLRKLQSGVIRTHGNDLIVEANERAEELFDRPFPSIGAGTYGQTVSFSALFVRAVRKADAWRVQVGQGEDHGPLFMDYSMAELDLERQNGIGTDYYILLHRGAERLADDPLGTSPEADRGWLHVFGAPMHNPATGLEIFASVARPSAERRAQLWAFDRGSVR